MSGDDAPPDLGYADTLEIGTREPFGSSPGAREPFGSSPGSDRVSGGPPSLPGSFIGRFECFQLLGQGGMGTVYRARDRQLDRDVALKFLAGGGAETSARVLREARSQARLEHENACKVYEVGVTDGVHHYIVMQYIDGESLETAKQRLTLEQKVRLIRQVASALHEAHRLGLVHRDVKPSNIMVEQQEDGAYKPYLMDFGIARDVSRLSQTLGGGMGTPAYMAPEQALGETESIDRRTDVYSLGATLYDLLCGSPPFTDTSLLRLLQKLAHEDATPLRKLKPGIPDDLDAIVMKCLEKEPGRRYESAKALGEELQRFLDGEPLEVRRGSFRYVFVKKLSRHKGKVAVVFVAFSLLLAVAIAWVRERQLAAERARLSSALGADVKEMELFLREAYALPLHDIDRHKDIVRARLQGIAERMVSAGHAADGIGNYAIGRGHLALREPDEAIIYLRKASAAGYSSPELDYAMGLALGELYKKALEATQRIENREQRQARIAALEAEYKQPALHHLRTALGARLETPAYAEGLIALYEGRYDEALKKAQEAFEQSRWLYEAKKLEGDAYFAEGSRFRHDAAFDYDRMMANFSRAAEAYRTASEIARSDSEVHAAECELWIQMMNASQAQPGTLRPSFDKATRACKLAVTASPRDGSARVKMAFAHQVFAWQAQQMLSEGSEIRTIVETAIAQAEEAARLSPEDPMAHYVSGSAWRTKFFQLSAGGLDARKSIDQAVAAYENTLRRDPAFLWAYNELCSCYAEKGLIESLRGLDPSASVRAAVERCDRAIELDPSFTYPYINKAIAYYRLARYLVDSGRSPEQALGAALQASAGAKARSPDSAGASNSTAWAHHLRAVFESDAGKDPTTSLALAEQSARDVEGAAPASLMSYELRGMLAGTKALHLLRLGDNPEPALHEARSSFQHLVDNAPWDLGYRLSRASVEVIGLRWALRHDKVGNAQIDAAKRPLLPMLDIDRAHPQLYLTLAEIHEIRARSLAGKKANNEDVSKGIEMCDKALAVHPKMAAAFATKGELLLLRARAVRDRNAKRDVARQAREAFAAAIRENPLIERDRRAAMNEAEQLLELGMEQP